MHDKWGKMKDNVLGGEGKARRNWSPTFHMDTMA